jgi:histone H3/H4
MAADDYSLAIARTVVAQIAEQMGFEGVQESALEITADALIRYMSESAKRAHQYAELASRTDVNVGDVLSSLEDMGTSVDELHAYLDSLSPVRGKWVPGSMGRQQHGSQHGSPAAWVRGRGGGGGARMPSTVPRPTTDAHRHHPAAGDAGGEQLRARGARVPRAAARAAAAHL